MKKFLILDGNALLHRAWHALPQTMTTKDGVVVNAAYGFTSILEKMRAEYKPDYLAVAWDLPGKTFRHEKFAEYKATREKKEDELYAQIPIIQEILEAYKIPSLSAVGMEADDVIGTLAKRYGSKKDIKVLILTGDLDALQLVDRNVEVVAFKKGISETKIYDRAAVKERYGLQPEQLVDLKALMGDKSDNVPGLPGVGQKSATELLQEFGSIDNIFKALKADKLPSKYVKKFQGQEDRAEKMRYLVQIVEDVKLPGFKISDAKVSEPDVASLIDKFRALGFRRFLKMYENGQSNKQNPITSRATVTPRKGKTSFVGMDKLDHDRLVVVVDAGEQDLFGGELRSLTLFDGERYAKIENPSADDCAHALDTLNGAKLVIGHDLKAVMHWLGAISAPIFDTQVGAYLLSPGSRSFDLSTVAYELLETAVKPDATPVEKAQMIERLSKKIKSGLKQDKLTKLARDVEMPLVRVLYEMENFGIKINPKHLKTLSKEFAAALAKLTAKIYKLAGSQFNINSPAQLAKILFEDLELSKKGIKKTKTGISTAASELEKLWDTHKIIPLISEYRELAKLKSTYIDALPKLIAADGRIHTSFNQTVTATGRLSSSDPNLQNIPTRTELGNEIRKAFVADRGRVLVSADYSQFELRLAAHMSGDKSFIKAFRDGADIHARTAAEILDKSEDQVTKKERSAAKAINFGILYGMGARHLARATGFDREEAQAFIDKYFAVHPEIGQYIDETKIKAHQDEFVATLFGRKRYLPDINSGVQQLVAAAERMAVNMPVQGTQADLVKMAMIEVDHWIKAHDFDVKMLLQVHDELVFEIKESEVKKVMAEIAKIMTHVYEFDVPLAVDVEVGKNWGEMKSLSL